MTKAENERRLWLQGLSFPLVRDYGVVDTTRATLFGVPLNLATITTYPGHEGLSGMVLNARI